MGKVQYLVYLALVGVAILFISAPASAANTKSCTPCHNDGRTITLDILEGSSTIPTTLNVGQSATISVQIQVSASPTSMTAGRTTLSNVALSLSSQSGHLSVSSPTYSVGTLAPGSATATWTITGLSAGSDSLLITGTGTLPHSGTSFFDSYSPMPAITVNSAAPSNYTLTVAIVSGGTVVKSPDAASYSPGSIVQLTAMPAAGWTFTGWVGGLTGSANPATVTMNSNLTVRATFTQKPPTNYTLTVTTTGSGTVTKAPNAASYNAGTTVQLTATPASGWSFTGWSVGLTGSANPASVTLNSNLTVMATFTQLLQTSITCTTAKPTLILGEGIAVSGVIAPAVSGAVVTIEYRMGSTVITRTYTTGGDSTYHSTYTPTAAGSWTVSASWLGNAQHQGATSQPLTITVSQPPTTGSLKVTVKDKDGKPLAGASVSSTSVPSGQTALSGVTGSDGSISFNDLKTGAYTVEARLSGYTTNTASVPVNAGGTTDQPITLQAQVNPPSGIPGYSFEAIILGAILAVTLLLLIRNKH